MAGCCKMLGSLSAGEVPRWVPHRFPLVQPDHEPSEYASRTWLTTDGPPGGNARPRRSGVEGVKVKDRGLESPNEVRKVGRAPTALRILGVAALAWGAILGLGMMTAIAGTQVTFGDVDTVGTLADWTATVALVVVGRGLLRSRWWAGIAAWATSLGLTAFGGYWAVWGNSDTGPGTPFPNPVTGAALPWPVFVLPGLVIAAMLLLPRSSRAWIQRAS